MATPSNAFALWCVLFAAGALALPAGAGGVYRTLSADGSVLFTDVPPLSDTPAMAQPGSAADEDALLAQANTKVDLAEHAFAIARDGSSSPRDGLRMTILRQTRGDRQRAAFYMKDLMAARARLLQLRRERMAPALSLEEVALR